MKKRFLSIITAILLLLLPGCGKRVTDPMLEGEWELIEGTGEQRIVIESDGGAFFGEEAVKWQIPEQGKLEITSSSRQITQYEYSVESPFLTLTAESGQLSRYVHPAEYPGDAAEQENLAGLWTDTDGRLTLYFDASGQGTRYGWVDVEDTGFSYAASSGRMRMTFPGDSGQWVEYALGADGTLSVLFEKAPDGGEPVRTLWKMASSDRLSGDYTVLYDTPALDSDTAIGFLSFDGKGGCQVDDVYGGYQYFENNVVIINAKGVHLSLTLDRSTPGFLTLTETGMDHRYTTVAEDPSLLDTQALTALAGIWSDTDTSHMLQIGNEGTGRVIWDNFEGAVSFGVTGDFLRVEPVDAPDDFFYLCFEKVGTVLYVGKSVEYPGGYQTWLPLNKLY